MYRSCHLWLRSWGCRPPPHPIPSINGIDVYQQQVKKPSYQGLLLMKCGYIPQVFLLNMLVLSIMYISEILFLPRIQGIGHYAVIKYVIFDKFVIFEMKYTTNKKCWIQDYSIKCHSILKNQKIWRWSLK